MTTKFRNEQNRRLTRGLFIEQTPVEAQDRCIYSLSKIDKTRNGKTYPSLYKLYMAENDILEHDFALKYFESWQHWQAISNAWWMKPLIQEWREELELRVRADALKVVQTELDAGGKYAYPAAVYLLKQGWKDKVKSPDTEPKSRAKVGRPSKASIAEEINRIAMEAHDVDADLARLGIKVN